MIIVDPLFFPNVIPFFKSINEKKDVENVCGSDEITSLFNLFFSDTSLNGMKTYITYE